MQTDLNVEDIVKTERRKVFHLMYGLPWILLVLLLGGISFYFYHQGQTLNKDVPSPLPKVITYIPSVTKTNWLTYTNYVTLTYTNLITIVKTNEIASNFTNFQTITTYVTVSNYIPNSDELIKNMLMVERLKFENELRIQLETQYKDKVSELSNAWDLKEKKTYEKALYDFQVEAVSNNYAEWLVDLKGLRSFHWKDISDKSIHGITLPPSREYPFTINNWDVAKDINLDIEAEINKIIINAIEAEFINRLNEKDQKLKRSLQTNVMNLIKRFFDGFETLNKENTRR